MKQNLLEKVSIYLLKKGYTIKSLTRTAFDILARKESQILLVKILGDADSVSEEYTKEMKKISDYISASPLIIAEKAGGKLQDNVVYARFGIYCLNYNTFCACADDKMPFIKRDHAGLKAQVIGDKLRQKIEEEGLSIGSLARKLGVSRKMVQRYEKGEAEITVNKALRLYDIFGHSVFDKVDIFGASSRSLTTSAQEKGKGDVARKYGDLGFEAAETKKVPFDVIARKDKEIILTEIGDKASPQLNSLSKLIEADKLVIFNKKKPKEKDIPALTKKEFLDFEKAKELIKFLKEFE